MDKTNRCFKGLRAILRKSNIELKTENFQLKNTIDHLPGDVYWKNREGAWLGVNHTGSETLKKMGFIKEKSDVLGKTDFQLFSMETASQFRKNDLEVMSKKIELAKEEINVLPSGEKIIQLSTKRPLYDEEGLVIGIVGNTVDITYLKHIEAALKAETANRAKAEFIANMSHDIRTPLTGILHMTASLNEKLLTPEGKQEVQWLKESGEQLLELCNNILEVVSAEHYSEQDLQIESFSLRELIEGIKQLEMPMVKSKGLEFLIDVDSHLPAYIMSDRRKLHRVLLNLLGNAIKFTSMGHVGISIQLMSKSRQNTTLKFSIFDTGIGIAPELHEEVFKRFFRAQASYKGVHRGHGIGLHIAQKYVQLLGGKGIHLESEEGSGSIFSFHLTFTKGQSSLPAQTMVPNTHSYQISHPPLVLVVEDSIIALRGLEALLTKAGCQFMSAFDGEQGFALAITYDFDVIITDIGLPGMSGVELTERVRAWEKSNVKPPVPIIALTGHALQETIEECLQAGINQVMIKPARLEEIQQLIQSYVAVDEIAPLQIERLEDYSERLSDTEEVLFSLEHYPLFDAGVAETLLGEDYKAILPNLARLIIESITNDTVEIMQAFNVKDWQHVRELAHKIRGGAASGGAVRLSYASRHLERYPKTGSLEVLEKLYHQLLWVMDDTKKHFEAQLGAIEIQ